MLEKPIKDYKITDEMSINEFVSQMEDAWGFTAGKIALGVKILEKMVKDEDCVKFLSFTANLVATGLRGALKELVKRKLVDVIITTCGALDHDLARCWKNYYRGDFFMDDKMLHEKGILVAPDIVVNAGGVISSYAEYIGENPERMFEMVKERISRNIDLILREALREKVPPRDVALRTAQKRVRDAMEKRKTRIAGYE